MKKVIITLAIIALAGVATAQDLIITELMYKDNNDGGDWIELYNQGDAAIDLNGLHMVDGDPGEPHDTHPHCYLAGTLEPGEVLVVAGDFNEFGTVYPDVSNLNANAFDPAGEGFGLGGGGDTIFILDGSDSVVFTMTYGDDEPWPTAPDGDGPSLLLISTDCVDFSDAGCWTAGMDGGTPGIITGTVSTQSATWDHIKGLYR